MICNIISLYFFVMAFLIIYFSARYRLLNESGLAHVIVLLCMAVCFYILGYTMELNAGSPAQILFWNRVEYVGIPFVSALWLTTALIYKGCFSRHKILLCAGIYLVPAISFLLRFTNDSHHLYFAAVRFENEYGRLVLVKTMGPWMYVQLFHSMLMIVVTLGLYIFDLMQNRANQAGKVVSLTAASLFAVSGLLLALIRPFGVRIDEMALCLPVSCVLIIRAMLRYDFLETKSMARSKVFEATKNAILLLNGRNKLIDCNRSAKQLFENMGVPLANESLETLLKDSPDLLKSLTDPEPTVVGLKVNGAQAYYDVNAWRIDGNASHGWIKMLQNITEIYQLNETLARQAMIDELSGLCNRRAFMKAAQEILRTDETDGGSLFLLMMDLDNFKQVNDRYGHQMGDRVIQEFGKLLNKNFEAPSLAARIGGEEFAVLLPDADDAEVFRKAESVQKCTELCEYTYNGIRFHVTVSIGITKKSRPEQTLDNLIKTADDALYESKKRGRNCYTLL